MGGARKGFATWSAGWQVFGRSLAVLFCVALILATITGISFFQMWNVANITDSYFGVPGIASSIVMAILVAVVVVGGIRCLGIVAGWLVPFMILLYIGGGMLLLLVNVDRLPGVFASIFRSAFSPQEAAGAFIGGTADYAFLLGLKRSLYSNEAGQGSWPIVHAAARTREPVREGIVAGLEPFIDTIIVCTFSALVILVSGVWNRAPEAQFLTTPRFRPAAFAYSTMISWIYYGEQGVVYIFGLRWVVPFRILVCALMVLGGTRFVETATEVDALTTLGTGGMLWVNIPLTILLASQAMRAYHDYIARLDRGDFAAERRK